MKKTASLLSAIFLLAFTVALMAQQSSTKAKSSHLGTWRLISIKYGAAKDFSDYPKDRQRVKLITATHFNWVDYDTKTKKVSSSAGGPCSYRDGVYIETIEFVGDGMETYLGQTHEFKIKVDGDKLQLSGKLSDGLPIEEVWQRLK